MTPKSEGRVIDAIPGIPVSGATAKVERWGLVAEGMSHPSGHDEVDVTENATWRFMGSLGNEIGKSSVEEK